MEGSYHLKITAIAATQQLSESCWIWGFTGQKDNMGMLQVGIMEEPKIRES